MHYIVFLILLVIPYTGVQAQTIHFVLSKDEPIYQQAQKDIQAEFNHSSLLLNQNTQVIDSFSVSSIQTTDLIVTIGNKAAIEINGFRLENPIISSFVDNSLINQLENGDNSNWAVIGLEQPIKHLITIAQQLITDSYKNKILVVISEDNPYLLTELNTLDKLHSNNLEIIQISHGELAAKIIEQYLFDSAVLVAVHDNAIWSGNSAKWLLQQAFIHKVPVIGYSKNFLVAGALVSVYTPIEAVISNTAMLINNWSDKGELGKSGLIYPPAQIDINSNIARSLHFPASKTDSLRIEE